MLCLLQVRGLNCFVPQDFTLKSNVRVEFYDSQDIQEVNITAMARDDMEYDQFTLVTKQNLDRFTEKLTFFFEARNSLRHLEVL